MSPVARDPVVPGHASRMPRASGGWLAGLVCLMLSAGLAVLFHQQRLQSLQLDLQRDAQRLSEQIESLSTDGKLMGSVMLMGLVDRGIKQLLAGERAPDDPTIHAVFQAVIGEYQADNVLVLDSAGRTRAYVSSDPMVRGLGRDLSVRPYFRRAMAGYANLYPAVGKNSGERGIYMAAPVRATPDPQAAVIGAVVVKIGADKLDAALDRYPHAAVLVSPEGLIFGGNRRPWLLQLSAPVSAEQRAILLRDEQFGDLFGRTDPRLLPLQFTHDGARLGDTRFTVAEEMLDWPATGKGWRLLLLRERTWVDAWLGSVALGLAVLALTLGACAYVLRRQRRSMRREQAHRANQARMRGMLDALPQGVATLDAAGCIMYANSALERMAGAPAKGLVGRPLSQLLDLQASPEQLLADCQSAPDQTVETQLVPLAGPLIPVGLGVASFDDGGERRLVASLRDISARHRMQEAVARELAFQQRLIDMLPNPLFIKDVQGRYTVLNRAFEEAHGVRREDMLNRTVLELTSMDAAARENAHAHGMEIIRSGTLQHRQFDYWTDGQLRQTLFWGQGLVDAEGRPAGMVGVVVDVSEQAAVRADLHAREQQLRNLLESTPGTVVVTNEQGQVLFYNRNALEMFRIDAETLIAQGVGVRYVDPAIRPMLLERLRCDGHVRGVEAEMVCGDGTHLWTQITLSRGDFGSVRDAIFAWSMDITERRQAAETMRAAKEAAEAATAAKSSFLANVSHEIRTPMNAIIGLVHLALQTPLSELQRDHLQKVHNAARSLLGIVNDILDFSRIEAGKLVLEQAAFDLDTLLAQLATMAGERAGDKPLELVFDVGPDVPRQLRGDALRLGQVLANLLVNAVKFTAQGEIVLCCRHRVGPDGALALEFNVRDTGIGMQPEQLTRLFTPFSQADASSTRKFGGTGLGLSIGKRLVDAAGGQIAVDSTPGHGAQFSVVWPCALATSSPPPAALPEALQGMRALVVDDHRAAGDVLAGMLARMGLVVDRAADADAALALLHADTAAPHGLVFADLHMPGMDGLALTRRLQSGGAVQPAVVLLASHGDAGLHSAAAQVGVVAVLRKPVTQAALASMLRGLNGPRAPLAEGKAIHPQIAAEWRLAAGVATDVVAEVVAPALPMAPPRSGLSDAQARTELARLCAMLESMDSEAGEQMERLENWLRLQLTNAEMQTLGRHVRQYDMDEALALLRQSPGLARWRPGHPEPKR